MRLTSTLSLRNLTQLEATTPELLPPELREWQFPSLAPEWCWVVERDDSPISLIITSPVHGILFFWRILSTASAKRSLHHLFAALPKILENSRVRGCVGCASFLHDDRPQEVKFARILSRMPHGVIDPWKGMLAGALIDAGSGNNGNSVHSLPDRWRRGDWIERLRAEQDS